MHRPQEDPREKLRVLVGLGMRARTLTVGSRDTRAALHRGEIRLVIVAEDGSERDRERIERICAEQHVTCFRLGSRDEWGQWLGRNSVAAAGMRDANLAEAIEKLAQECMRARRDEGR